MKYHFEKIDEVLEKRWCAKCKVDYLLHVDANLYQNLGKDSLKSEREDVRKKSRKIYLAIKKISPEIGERLVSSMD